MATYAAMVDRLDRNIGRLFEKRKALKVDDNTVFMFLSDNGGCPFDRGKKLERPPWEGGGHWTYDKHWASASNTPLRWYKQNSHEGGIASPFIVRWPAKIRDGGKWVRDPSHLVDVMPTCMELSGGKYPDKFGDVPIPPYAGASLLKTWRGESLGERTLYWSYGNNKAVRVGDWKLVAAEGKPWELYNLSADRTELHDLVASEPARVEKMNELWQAWHKRDDQGDDGENGEEQKKGRQGQGSKKKKPSK
jgi:arylsulfatase A-like enzyme